MYPYDLTGGGSARQTCIRPGIPGLQQESTTPLRCSWPWHRQSSTSGQCETCLKVGCVSGCLSDFARFFKVCRFTGAVELHSVLWRYFFNSVYRFSRSLLQVSSDWVLQCLRFRVLLSQGLGALIVSGGGFCRVPHENMRITGQQKAIPG